MIISVFFFYLSLFIVQAWTVLVKKDTKKSLNNKPIKTITDHLIEITNHKIHGVQNTHSEVSLNGTLVASYLRYWFRLMITAAVCFFYSVSDNDQHTVSPFVLSSIRSAVPDCTQISVGCWQCVCSGLVKSWSLFTNFSTQTMKLFFILNGSPLWF